ncbi:MAG TPA: nucleotide sugar dehydrogenase, partial [Candidatus Kapabacteria bacterium]|nr:nucleotide sugar dehydrogenase [Candidatus Kapabacteria bacterium]
EIGARMRKGQVVILKSTTFPSTTESYVLPILEKRSKLKVGKDFSLAFSPERIDPGNTRWNTANIPNVVGGVTASCTRNAAAIVKQAVTTVKEVSSPRVAEMEKLLENIFRSVNIALVNELAQLCDRMGGINMWEVVDAASSKPFGFMPFYPGPGIGGHCILIDPYYLEWYARQYDFHTNFIGLAAEVNESMPFYVCNMVLKELSRLGKSYTKAKILFLGVAFKRDVDDTRHSPALKVMELLQQAGVKNLTYNDPFVPSVDVEGKSYKSVALTAAAVKNADIVVITTDHTKYDYATVVKNAKCIVDTRNATKSVRGKHSNVHVLGSGV